MIDCKESWLRLAKQVGGRLNVAIQQYEIIAAAYSGRNRFYHNLEHISSCLGLLTQVKQPLSHWNALILAIWLHDLVFVPDFQYNEQLSSAVAHSFILELTNDSGLAYQVGELIMATKHDQNSNLVNSLEVQYLADIDLAILGESPTAYLQYEQAIRREYGYLSDAEYFRGRSQVLYGLLNKPYLYTTAEFRCRFEAPARINITKTLAEFSAADKKTIYMM